MQELVGKKVLAVNFDHEEHHFIQFKTEEGNFLYYTYGECCSHSYFTDIKGVSSLIGHIVISVDKVVLPVVIDNEEDMEHIQAYGYNMKTTGGYVNFVFHNESNGYYGGSLDLVENLEDWEIKHGCNSLKPLIEDFSQ